MSMFAVPYSPGLKDDWDRFIRGSKNGTFLFERDYMEYHANRFRDRSFLIYDESRALVALMPGNEDGRQFVSHGGLTYGGLVVDTSATVPRLIEVFDEVLRYLRDNEFEHLLYKSIPWIYHVVPAEEDRYCLFLHQAALYRRDVLTVIDYRFPLPPQARRRRGAGKAARAGLIVQETTSFEPFWRVLTKNLRSRYGRQPVHSADEIARLAARFPGNIKLYAAAWRGEVMGGVVLYLSPAVAHAQYIAASEEGKAVGALDLVFEHVIERYRSSHRYFDFGTSTEDDGRRLNQGLIEQKEGFGGRAVVHDFYHLRL